MEGIRGRVALVSGGGSGIGRACAAALAQAGAKVVVSDIGERGGDIVLQEIRAATFCTQESQVTVNRLLASSSLLGGRCQTPE